MRFLHQDFAPLETYLQSRPCDIRRLEWDLHPVESGSFAFLPWTVKHRSAHAPEAVGIAEVRDCFHRAEEPRNAGTLLSVYFHVNAPPTDRAVSLEAAVEHVEAFGSPTEFLLAGYHDGGLISVSRGSLPFQNGIQEASGWWGLRTSWPMP